MIKKMLNYHEVPKENYLSSLSRRTYIANAFYSLQIFILLDKHELSSHPTIGELVKNKLELEAQPAAILTSAMVSIPLNGDAALYVAQHCDVNAMLIVARTAEEFDLLLADNSGMRKK